MVKHFLLVCPGYVSERWKLRSKASKLSKSTYIETLLGNLDLTLPLANFINATHHFKLQDKPDTMRTTAP